MSAPWLGRQPRIARVGDETPRHDYLPIADHGIIGDLHKIVPKLTEAIKAKKG